jgi:hypothetical protein
VTQTATLFDLRELERQAPEIAVRFRSADPFPHAVLDGLLTATSADVASFPDADWEGWTKLGDTYQHNKRACDDITRIPEPMASLIGQLSTPAFLKVLEEITGIEKLVPDPYLTGGGLHLSGPGGVLAPHTDFHHYRTLDLFRRINVLVYLNDDWEFADGGCLTLYDGDKAVETVVPTFGRTVIFRTDDQSVHGFPTPVAEGKWRRSVALYYYTASPAAEFSGDETTYWREHGAQHGVLRRTRMALYRALLNTSRAISILAHIVNPNQGMGLVRARLEARRRASEEN